MRKILLGLLALSALHYGYAQPRAGELKTKYDKSEKVAAVIELPYPPDVVEEAIKNHLASKGNKADKTKGFTLFRGTKLSDEDLSSSDVYFKVERKSRREKDISVVYLFAGTPNENLSKGSHDQDRIERGKAFLNGIVPVVESHNNNRNIIGQEETVRKNEKKLKELQNDQAELEKRISDLQEKLEQNALDQQKQTEEIEREKAILESMKAKAKA
jgi:hypothetical protein